MTHDEKTEYGFCAYLAALGIISVSFVGTVFFMCWLIPALPVPV